jgi:hypothetical protein
MEMSGQIQIPVALPSWKNRGTHWIGGCLGLSTDLKVFGKKKNPSPLLRFEPRTVQVVA